ncbi:hypothetical protein [Vibrio nitrifigilis]|uniref:Uncharacterized protein n=1 Tax=Vibrio nitrifigilis TaxID=2789781 RepID=A0ABS0GDR6_9VIBR|nr:hypothetical protein [Vibrio nitrifigilis]MBF9000553.1 hypothetical protein [Vibrio nitrifigilis]
MDSPLERIESWYQALPLDHKIDLAYIVASCCPGFELIDLSLDSDNIPTEFIRIMSSVRGDIMREIGMILMLRGVIEYFIISRRSDPDGWKDNKNMMEELAIKTNSDNFRQKAQEMEFRGKQWLSSCEKWFGLREQISDQNLGQYETQQLTSRIN